MLALTRRTQAEVLRRVREDGGFSVFWATENQTRARIIDHMVRLGEIVRLLDDPRHVFPWCVYRVGEDARQ